MVKVDISSIDDIFEANAVILYETIQNRPGATLGINMGNPFNSIEI